MLLSGFELSPRWVPLTRKRDQTRGVRGHATPGKFHI